MLLNKIYDIRLAVIVNSFLANPENREDLKRVIPRICHEETIIPEENLRELIRIFNQHTSDQTPQRKIFKIRKLYKFILKKIIYITIKRYIYSIDDEDDDERYFDIWLMIHADDFREFPIIPDSDRDVVRKNNIYNWFRYWFRRYKEIIVLDMMIRQTGVINEETVVINEELSDEEDEVEIVINEKFSDEIINEQFSDEVDEKATEVISCRTCLVNTPKVIFSCGHCTCISCANKLNDCHICTTKI